jgi:electron transfer flavoprotein beta subunit
MEIKERIGAGAYQVSTLSGPPAVFGWATGELPEPPNNPQVGMVNMKTVMPALQQAKPAQAAGPEFLSVELPRVTRETRVVKDAPIDEMARDIADWIKA